MYIIPRWEYYSSVYYQIIWENSYYPRFKDVIAIFLYSDLPTPSMGNRGMSLYCDRIVVNSHYPRIGGVTIIMVKLMKTLFVLGLRDISPIIVKLLLFQRLGDVMCIIREIITNSINMFWPIP